MARNSKKVVGRILPERLQYARTQKGMTQAEVAYELQAADVSENNGTITNQLISFFENGRRHVPLEYNVPLARILNVTVAYLQGLTQDPQSEKPDEIVPDEITTTEIPFNRLYQYDGRPVYVEFNRFAHESGWGIYDREKSRIVFKDLIYKITPAAQVELKFFCISPEYFNKYYGRSRSSLTRDYAMKKEYVYIEMNTSDNVIRERYNGWYHHNETKTNFINDKGLVLPYDGFNISYTVYADK